MSSRIARPEPNGLSDVRANFNKLERREWWRWGFALLVTVVLTLGILSLSLGVSRPDMFEQSQLKNAANGLLGLVLIFDVFAIYQQILISRLRGELAAQIGMLGALEVLKPPTNALDRREERRQVPRTYLDALLKVKRIEAGPGEKPIYGRTRDVSEFGIGAVIPESLHLGETVLLEFSLGPSAAKLDVSAVLRHRQGFHHGFELIGLSQEEIDAIRQLCPEEVPIESGD